MRGLPHRQRSDVRGLGFVAVAQVHGEGHLARRQFDDGVEVTLLFDAGVGVAGGAGVRLRTFDQKIDESFVAEGRAPQEKRFRPRVSPDDHRDSAENRRRDRSTIESLPLQFVTSSDFLQTFVEDVLRQDQDQRVTGRKVSLDLE